MKPLDTRYHVDRYCPYYYKTKISENYTLFPSQDKRAIKNESRIEFVRFPQRLYAS